MAKYDPRLKPYWNKDLTKLSKKEKDIMWEYRAQGRPRDENNPIRIRYKEAKRIFQYKTRHAERDFRRDTVIEVEEKGEMDQRAFWYCVNKSKGLRQKKRKPIRDDNGNFIYDEIEQVQEWKDYCEILFSPSENEQFDEQHKEEICREVELLYDQSYMREDVVLRDPYTVAEVSLLCKNLNKDKAPGWDMIDPEHLIYGGEIVYSILTSLYNAMNILEKTPIHLKRKLIVPIEKPGLDSTYKNNNRGLSIGPIIGKVYDKLILKRWEPWIRENKVVSVMQGAGNEKCSSLHTSWLLREAIAYNTERKMSVHICLLDIKKAFDTVWKEGLMVQLYRTGVEGKLWRIIYEMYDGAISAIKIGNQVSDWFSVKQGVHQGAPLSMLLFEIFFDPLLVELLELNIGAHIGDINVSCPTSADDMALAALSGHALQSMVTVAYNYSCKWRFCFSPPKCICLTFGGIGDRPENNQIRLGQSLLNTSSAEKHLGTVLTPSVSNDWDYIEKRIQKVRHQVYGFMSMGGRRYPVNPMSVKRFTILHVYPKCCMDCLFLVCLRNRLNHWKIHTGKYVKQCKVY
jgi:hypothetical protein